MTERRSLVDGLQNTPKVQELEKEFVFGATSDGAAHYEVASEKPKKAEVMPQFRGRVPLTTRCRPELASAIKRISLERQLSGAEPSTMQDILEQALEQWLARYG